MKLTIIPSDNSVYVDQIGYTGIDMSWIPDIDGKKIHAVQWSDTEGEIEFVGPHQNLTITELDIFEQAIELWNEKKLEEDTLLQQKLDEEAKKRREEEDRIRSQFLDIDDEFEILVSELDEYGYSEQHIAPSETHLPPVEPLMHEEEDEDLFYDIEELLKEI